MPPVIDEDGRQLRRLRRERLREPAGDHHDRLNLTPLGQGQQQRAVAQP
jgi:hypothetical protein